MIPQYRKLADLIHSTGKPFLFHSCGNIFTIMDDVIDGAKIDAKHSNEDSIVTFDIWVKKYGDRIGNFGGIDVDALCRLPEAEMHTYIQNLINKCIGHGGFAFGTGNSVPDYVPVDQYLIMNKIVREIRDKIHG